MPKVLVIDDNEHNSDLISRYLAIFGYDVVVAVDGQSGLQEAHANRDSLDVILLDMNLPDVDGWEVARRLKGNEATESLPIVALTAHAMVGDREKALEAGCDDYASKPIDFTSLLQTLDSIASSHKVRTQ